jgi:hypothetical protein
VDNQRASKVTGLTGDEGCGKLHNRASPVKQVTHTLIARKAEHVSGRVVHYAIAAILVRLADEGARIALTLLALQRTGSAATGGVLIAALLVPHVVAAPAVGLLTDRARRPQLTISAAAFVFAIALATAVTATGRVPLGLIIGILVIGGCGGPALTGALSSQLSGLVDAAALDRAFGLDSLTYNLSGILGPAVAAVLSGLAAPEVAAYALAGSAALGAACIATLPTPNRQYDVQPRPRALDGIRVMVHDRILATVTVATSIGQLGAGALPVIAAVFAARNHDAAAAGWLMTAFAAGGLAGSLAWTWRPASPANAARVVMAGLVGVGIPIAAAAGSSSLRMTAALLAVSGFFNGPLFGALLTTRQVRAPDGLRSQIFTLGAGAKITATAAGAASAGVIAHASSPAQLIIVAAFPLLAGTVGTLRLPRPDRQSPLGTARVRRS